MTHSLAHIARAAAASRAESARIDRLRAGIEAPNDAFHSRTMSRLAAHDAAARRDSVPSQRERAAIYAAAL